MAGKGGKKAPRGGVIIKKYEIVEGGHHGGAWKVAYADFVTAMMAFFLLMWLLNATTEDQRKGLADYFSPNNLMSHASSGTGEPFGGHTAFDEGALASDRGSVQAVVGKAPVPDQTEDGKDPVTTSYHRARVGEGVGVGPVTDDQDADDEHSDAPVGQPGTRRPPGPGGRTDGSSQGQARLNRDAVTAEDGTEAAQAASGQAGQAASGQAGQAGMTQAGASQTRPGQNNFVQNGAGLNGAGQNGAGQDGAAQNGEARSAASQARAEQAQAAAQQARAERAAFQAAAEQIKDAVRSDPALADLAKQLAIDMTPEGLRIQIMDEIKLPMFPSGSATPNERARLLMQKVVPVLMRLSQPISIAGHTDAAPYPGRDRTNWELSAERANATRRLLTDGGLPDTRIQSVTGHADRDPLLPADPLAAANRRIAILVLRESPLPGAGGRTPAQPPAPQPGSAQPRPPQPAPPQPSPTRH